MYPLLVLANQTQLLFFNSAYVTYLKYRINVQVIAISANPHSTLPLHLINPSLAALTAAVVFFGIVIFCLKTIWSRQSNNEVVKQLSEVGKMSTGCTSVDLSFLFVEGLETFSEETATDGHDPYIFGAEWGHWSFSHSTNAMFHPSSVIHEEN